jgi:hypothetical protein
MEISQSEFQDETVAAIAGQDDPPSQAAHYAGPSVIAPQACATCGAAPAAQAAANRGTSASSSWVYAIGSIEARFPSISVEKEFAQATGRNDTAGLTDRQALHAVLSSPENRYLVRQLCWVLTIQGLDTYVLIPRDPGDISLLIEAVRPNPSPLDLDVVIGTMGPIAPSNMCNGLTVPIVAFDQIYSFDRNALIKAIPKPEKISAKEFGPAAEQLFDRIVQMTDNAGATDEHRALNYLAVRYQAQYAKAAEYFAQDCSLSSVTVQASRLSGVRSLLDVIFAYTNRNTDVVDKCFVRVDVTDQFPFLVTKLSPYYDH